MGSNNVVRILTKDEYHKWDELVHKSPQGTIFHTSKWVMTCSELSLKKGNIYGYFKKDQLLGGCLFYSYKKFNFISIAESNALITPYGGFIFLPNESSKVRINENIRSEIIFSINNEMIKTFDIITLVNSPGLLDIRPFTWHGWREQVYYDYIVCLEKDIYLNLLNQTKTNIRKAQKIGITVKNEYNPDIYWKLTKKTFEKQDMKIPFKKEYLLGLMEMLIHNNLGEMWIARTSDGEPASAVFSAYDPPIAYGWVAANDPIYKSTGVTSLLFFEMFKSLQEMGYQRYNLMAANTPHLARFYSSFNPELVPYFKVEKMARKYLFLKTLWSFIK